MDDALTLRIRVGQNELVLKKRLGFVKLAMRHGAELVPSFVFGEKFLYKYVPVWLHVW